jgi:phosphate transport system protein
MMPGHLEASLQHDMNLIRGKVQEMTAHCERAVVDAVEALVRGDRQAAYLVILHDRQVDDLEEQLDRLCLEFLVRQQPAAGPLRFAYAAIKISTELESIGDHAETVARRLLQFEPARPAIRYADFQEIAQTSVAMLRDAVRSFAEGNADLARRTMLTEPTVDRMRRDLERSLARQQRAGELDPSAAQLLSTIARRLERVSDKARNICAEALYAATGTFAKHRAPEVIRILFVDQHNHCRSQMAEAIASRYDHPRLLFTSAGMEPRSIDRGLAPFLDSKGLDIASYRTKDIEHVPNVEHYHVVVGFDEGAYYTLRFRQARTRTVCIDWCVEDPSLVEGPPEVVEAAYERAYVFISDQLKDLVEALVRQD